MGQPRQRADSREPLRLSQGAENGRFARGSTPGRGARPLAPGASPAHGAQHRPTEPLTPVLSATESTTAPGCPRAPSHLLPLRGRLGSVVIPALSARPPPAGRVPACGGSGGGGGGGAAAAPRSQAGGGRREAARPSRAQGRGARRRPRLWRSVELFSAQVLSLPPAHRGSGGAPSPARRWLRRSAASARHSERPPARRAPAWMQQLQAPPAPRGNAAGKASPSALHPRPPLCSGLPGGPGSRGFCWPGSRRLTETRGVWQGASTARRTTGNKAVQRICFLSSFIILISRGWRRGGKGREG